MMREGTIVDATLIATLPSIKNKDSNCDPKMSQSKKRNDWDLGMKAHFGLYDASGLVQTVVNTPGDVSDGSKHIRFCMEIRSLRSAMPAIRA